jgi:hypothetical protein
MNFSKKLPLAYLIVVGICVISLIIEFRVFYYFLNPLIGPILIIYIFSKFKNLEHPLIPIFWWPPSFHFWVISYL